MVLLPWLVDNASLTEGKLKFNCRGLIHMWQPSNVVGVVLLPGFSTDWMPAVSNIVRTAAIGLFGSMDLCFRSV